MAWIKDRDSIFIAVNKAIAAASGMEIRDMIGKTDYDCYPKELAERYRADDRQVMQSRQARAIEEPFTYREGKTVWIETIKTPLFNARGEVAGTAGIARKSQRKFTEEQLLKSEEGSVSWPAPAVIIFESDINGRITYANDMVSTLFGYNLDELMGQPLFSFLAPEEKEKAVSNISHVLNGKYLGNNEYIAMGKDGRRSPVLIQSAPRKNSRGEITGLRGVMVDISRQKKIENELRASERFEHQQMSG